LVERKPSKLDVAGSSPVSRFAALACAKRKEKYRKEKGDGHERTLQVLA
jgi:hypothetical protein